MWNEADPRVTMCLQSALRSFRHEILLDNFIGIPIMLQHGSADDNVPVFHSRRLYQLIRQREHLGRSRYVELEGKGHWYDGVMTTPNLEQFLDNVLKDADYPQLPLHFNIVIANPADMGPRGGLSVDRLINPDEMGRVNIVREDITSTWTLHMSNIVQFRFVDGPYREHLPSILVIDGQAVEYTSKERLLSLIFLPNVHGQWSVSHVQRNPLPRD